MSLLDDYVEHLDPARPAGEMHLEERGGAIARIRVLYEQFSGRPEREDR